MFNETLYESTEGDVFSDYSLERFIFLLTGEHFEGKALEWNIKTRLLGIKGKIDPAEWQRFAKTNKMAAVRMYKTLTDCTIKQAVKAVNTYLESEDAT